MISTATLTDADVAAHTALGISPDLLARAQVCRVDDFDARERLTSKHPGDLAGILYPYLSPVNGHTTTYRLRRDHPEIENGMVKDKYLSAWGDRKRLYFPPHPAALLADIAVPVIIVEAEKSVLSITSAAACTGRDVLAVGTGGCWGWRGRIGKTEDASGARVDETGILPDFDLLAWTGRAVVIVFDTNASTNTQVQVARRMLAKALTERGATVRIIDIPAEPNINGPDDFIGRHGAAAFFALIDAEASDAVTETFPLTEAGDAEFFASVFGNRIRFDHRQDRWLILNEHSGIWLPDRTGHITTLALEAVRMRQSLAFKITDSDKRQKALAWTMKGESRARLTNLLALAQDLVPISDAGDEWDTIPYLLGTPNGVVDLRTSKLRRALPDERITMRTSIPYDPQAESALWTKVLKDIFPDNDERTWLQTTLGYATTGSMKLDKWFLPNGEKGRNGKGTIFGAVATALGDYAMEIDAASFDKHQKTPYNLAQLPGKRFVHCSEAGNTTTLHHERVKQVTGGDPMRAADKYERAFQFRPCCKLFLTCNDRPRVTDESAAFWARVNVVLFQQTFLGKEDTSIRDALREEPVHQRAVLRWLVDGARKFYEQDGLGKLPPAFELATNEFRHENERLADFFAERCVEVTTAETKASDLWAEYQAWVIAAGVRKPLGSKKFFQALAKRFEKKEKNDLVWYFGVGLVTTKDAGPSGASKVDPGNLL